MVETLPDSCTTDGIGIDGFLTGTEIHDVGIRRILTDAGDGIVSICVTDEYPICWTCRDISRLPYASIHATHPNSLTGGI